MIFNLYQRVAVKVGDSERYIFDRSRLMFTEVAEIQKITDWSYGEWERQLGRYDIVAVAALVHVLRKRENVPSNWATMQFNATELDVVPIHDDGSEFTKEEIAKDLADRISQTDEPDPTIAAAAVAIQAEEAAVASRQDMTITSLSLRGSTESGRGSSTSSRGKTSASSRRTSTAAG